MGGKAVTSYRMDSQTHDRFLDHVVPVLVDLHLDEERVYPVRSFENKASHGDLDVLFMKPATSTNDLRRMRDAKHALMHNETDLEVLEYNSNGDILSMAVMFEGKPRQLDVIFTWSFHWHIAKVFYDFNDMGNLMGKVARWHRMKWGFQGLRYVVYSEDGSRKLDEITLTGNPATAFEILGFDWQRYQKGFVKRSDVWEYVLNGALTDPRCFLPKNLNAGQRQRDTKRTGYELFMKYLDEFVEIDMSTERPSHEDTWELVHDKIGINLEQQVNALRMEDAKLQKAAEKFNGRVILDHFKDLKGGPKFGKMMKEWNNMFPTDVAKAEFYLQNNNGVLLTLFKETFEL